MDDLGPACACAQGGAGREKSLKELGIGLVGLLALTGFTDTQDISRRSIKLVYVVSGKGETIW